MSNRDSTLTESERKIAELSELAGGLAHELRNPLSTMMINLKLLAEDLHDSDAHPDDVRRRALLKVDALRREAERLQSLFDDFLNLTGPCRLQRKDEDLNTVVARLAEFIGPLASNKKIVVRLDLSPNPVVCEVDENLLSQALLNLVINAQDSMPDGGELRITTGIEGGLAVVAITDSGVGIAGKDGGRILRPFFSTKGSGNGLGLSITQRIVEEHGGTLSFESEVGRGTTFTVALPLQVTQSGGPVRRAAPGDSSGALS